VLVRTFDGQSIDFFGALRARVYDDAVRAWIKEVGNDAMGPLLINPRRDKVGGLYKSNSSQFTIALKRTDGAGIRTPDLIPAESLVSTLEPITRRTGLQALNLYVKNWFQAFAFQTQLVPLLDGQGVDGAAPDEPRDAAVVRQGA
jgi:hypothetical protein